MPADNIKKAIMRGTGELEGGQIEEVMFEGYGPGGAAVLVNVATDNRNRTVSEIRHVFSKNGGNMGEQGSVAWMFERKSQIFVPSEKAGEDQLMDIVLDAGADDLRNDGDRWEILSAPEAHEAVLKALEANGIPMDDGEHRHGAQEPGQAGRQERRRHAAAATRRWKSTTTCRTSTPTSISTRRSWRRWRNSVRVLGIDCGSERTGYGVIESDGAGHRLLAAGVIRTEAKSRFEERLLNIAKGLRAVIGEQRPERAAVEDVFYAANAKTALKLAHVRGVALLAVAEAGIELAEYSPLEVKISVVGYGRAEKSQVQVMVQSLLRLAEAIDSEDACDALAVAICHATRQASALRVAAAQVGRGQR